MKMKKTIDTPSQ